MADTARTPEQVAEIKRDFAAVISKHSLESDSDTPDLILAQHLYDCLMTWNKTSRLRHDWFGPTNRA
jgi:hypothetical protein